MHLLSKEAKRPYKHEHELVWHGPEIISDRGSRPDDARVPAPIR